MASILAVLAAKDYEASGHMPEYSSLETVIEAYGLVVRSATVRRAALALCRVNGWVPHEFNLSLMEVRAYRLVGKAASYS